MRTKLKTIICVLVALAWSSNVAFADVAANIDTGSITSTNTSGSGCIYGWDFTSTEDIVVTHLGLYDHDNENRPPTDPDYSPGDGLLGSYEVRLWRIEGGSLVEPALASAIVGPGAQLLANHRYIDVEDVELSKDYSYYIGFNYSSGSGFDRTIVRPQSVGTANSPINIGSQRWDYTVNLPTLPGYISEYDYLGVNFQFTTEPIGPVELIEDLIDKVELINGQQGINNSLDAKLDAAVKALQDVNENNDISAVNKLEAFINEVEAQRDNKLTEEQADDLVAAAQAIINLLTGA
ncbi:MAG: hypothetical protein ACETVZ_03990 [Phycisphaerae bacterium]